MRNSREPYISDLPIRVWSKAALSTLVDLTLYVIEEQDVAEFCIGQTYDLSAAKAKHNCDNILPLYEANGTNNANVVEYSLEKIFNKHPCCRNNNNGGAKRAGDGGNYVYIAVWY